MVIFVCQIWEKMISVYEQNVFNLQKDMAMIYAFENWCF